MQRGKTKTVTSLRFRYFCFAHKHLIFIFLLLTAETNNEKSRPNRIHDNNNRISVNEKCIQVFAIPNSHNCTAIVFIDKREQHVWCVIRCLPRNIGEENRNKYIRNGALQRKRLFYFRSLRIDGTVVCHSASDVEDTPTE